MLRTETLLLVGLAAFLLWQSQQKAQAAAPVAPQPERPNMNAASDWVTMAASGLGAFAGGFINSGVPKSN